MEILLSMLQSGILKQSVCYKSCIILTTNDIKRMTFVGDILRSYHRNSVCHVNTSCKVLPYMPKLKQAMFAVESCDRKRAHPVLKCCIANCTAMPILI